MKFSSGALALLLLGLTQPAFGAAPSEVERQEARDLMARGREQRQHSDLRGALDSFSQADSIMQVPSTGIEVARTMRKLGMLVEAAQVVVRIQAIPQSPDEPEAFSKARGLAQELELELDARTPRVYFYVPGASSTKLVLDGNPLDVVAIAQGLRINPGSHVATAMHSGVRRKQTFDVAETKTVEVSFDFTDRSQRASEPPSGHGNPESSTPASTIALYGLTGLAVAGVGVGTSLAIVASHNWSTLEKSCAPNCSEKSVAQVRGVYMARNISLGVGAASAIGALTIYLVRPKDSLRSRDETAGLTLIPGVGDDPGVSLQGSF